MTHDYFKTDASFEEVIKALTYDPLTGLLTWNYRHDRPKEWNTRRAGKVAGHHQKFDCDNVYVMIRLNGVLYLAHRIAWLVMTGAWPDHRVDHRNRDGTDNRWPNLRRATQMENTFNRVAQKNSRSGIKGISRHGNRWRVRIKGHGEAVLRSFTDLEEAKAWHAKMERAIHGAFAPQSS